MFIFNDKKTRDQFSDYLKKEKPFRDLIVNLMARESGGHPLRYMQINVANYATGFDFIYVDKPFASTTTGDGETEYYIAYPLRLEPGESDAKYGINGGIIKHGDSWGVHT